EVVITGSLVRMRPVIMTALVAAFGFLPMATSTSNGAEVQKPLATVVIGGVFTDTLLTLLLVPVLYWLMYRGKQKVLPLALLLCAALPTAVQAQSSVVPPELEAIWQQA